MSNAEIVVGGGGYRVSMDGKGGTAGEDLRSMGGAEVSRVSMQIVVEVKEG